MSATTLTNIRAGHPASSATSVRLGAGDGSRVKYRRWRSHRDSVVGVRLRFRTTPTHPTGGLVTDSADMPGQISRRRFIIGGAAVVGGAAFLNACGDDDDDEAGAP